MRCSAYGTIVPSSSDRVRLFIDGRSRDKCLNDQRRGPRDYANRDNDSEADR